MTLLSVETPRAVIGRLESGQADIDLLHCISTALIAEQDHNALYGKIVDAAITITGSQFGTMQLLCPQGHSSGNGGKLSLLCSRGLPDEAVTFWEWVSPEAYSSCTKALKSGRREIVHDFEEWDEIADTEDLFAFRRTGIRSAQTTPLLSRDGHLLGMISTHWCEPHTPSERDLRLLDILARQAADLLERTIAEE
ncbi:MAG: GAF domain-containing protein, partial [Gemmatimonadaceae bacterium]|nr:GAF domain-containing protein [Caulobacter sp.]